MKRRGFILILSLFLCLLFFVVGIAYLSLKANQYRSANESQRALQAKGVAEAGLEDLRIKLQRDGQFPPPIGGSDQYGYREQLVVGGKLRGTYSVTLDNSYALPPYQLLIATVTGEVGESTQDSVSRRSFRVEIDLAPFLRSDPDTVNPRYRQILSLQDLGGS